MMFSRVTLRFLICCVAWFAIAVEASTSIVKGFATKDVPSLDQLPKDFASIVNKVHNNKHLDRKLETDDDDDDEEEEEYDDDEKKGKSKKEKSEKEEKSKKKKRKEAMDLPMVELPEANQDITERGELSFAILLDEFGYSTADIRIGTKFAFSGRLASETNHVGNGSGVCTIASDINTNFAICNFYLLFNQDGESGFGTLTLAGNTDDQGGVLQVTGSGDDLKGRNQGIARLAFDPAGNPIIYILIGLQ